MKEALFVGGLGGLLHGIFYSFTGDVGWFYTLIMLALLGLSGGALFSFAYEPGGGISSRNILVAFLMGFLPNTIFLYVIGSDNLPIMFGFEAGVFTSFSVLMTHAIKKHF